MASTQNNVLPMPGKVRLRKASTAPRPVRPPHRRQLWSAVGVAVVAIVLTGLSLSHLAHGIELVTRCPVWESWAMAIGIDLAFVALELSMLCASTQAVRREIGRFAKPAILGTIIASAAMNSLAFGAQAEGWMIYPAVGLGLAVPALIYVLSRVAFSLAASR